MFCAISWVHFGSVSACESRKGQARPKARLLRATGCIPTRLGHWPCIFHTCMGSILIFYHTMAPEPTKELSLVISMISRYRMSGVTSLQIVTSRAHAHASVVLPLLAYFCLHFKSHRPISLTYYHRTRNSGI